MPAPSSWLIENADLLPSAASTGRPRPSAARASGCAGGPAGPAPPRALDVACGSGRHALILAAAGFEVHAIDRDAASIETLRAAAGKLGLALRAEVRDLETGSGDPDIGPVTDPIGGAAAGPAAALGPAGGYDLIVVFHYLHRPLFPALVRALAPGGLLLYETFTVDQAVRGHPKNPAFLLEHGELPRLVAPLEILRQREGEFDGRFVAAVAARAGKRPVRSRS